MDRHIANMQTPGRSRHIQLFESSIERLARVLSEKWKIRVVFKHGACMTEGRTIYLPVIPNDADEAFMDAILGHMDHEVAHIIFSDFTEFQGIQYAQQLYAVANAVEDPRVERKYVDLWRGSAGYLSRSLEWLLVRFATPRETRDERNNVIVVTPWSQLSSFSKFVRALTLYPQVNYDLDHWFFQDVVEPEHIDRVRLVDDLIRKGVAADTTKEAIAVAREILARVRDPQSAPEPEEQTETVAGVGEMHSDPPTDEDAEDAKDQQAPQGTPSTGSQSDETSEDEEAAEDDSSEREADGDDASDQSDADAADTEGQNASSSQGQRSPSQGSDGMQKGSGADGQQGEADQDEKPGGEQDARGETPADGDPEQKSTHASSGGSTLGDGEEHEGEDGEAQEEEQRETPEPPKQQPKPESSKKESRQKMKLPPPIGESSKDQLLRDQLLTALGEQLRQEAAAQVDSLGGYAVFSTDGDKVERIENGDRALYKNFITQSAQLVAVLKRNMSRSLMSTKVSRWQPNQTRGRINPRAVFRVPLGTSKRVFRKKVVHEGFNTAVEIMVDHSGSMKGPKLELAARTAVVIAEVCHKIGLPVAIYGFSTGIPAAANQRYLNAPPGARSAFTRWGDHWIGVYKDFDESWDKAASRCIMMPANDRVNTYDGESLRWGARQLLARKEQRKILFWLNDGMPQPNRADNQRAHVDYAHQCAKEVERYVELVAVGIMTDDVRDFYSHCVVVNELKDLPGVCLQEFNNILRSGKNRKR